jgi:hypothetical protein
MNYKLYIISLALLLISCSANNEQITKAIELCEKNDGLSYVKPDLFTLVIRCKNDAVFRID